MDHEHDSSDDRDPDGGGYSDGALNRWAAVGDEPADALARDLLTTYGVDEHGCALDEVDVLGRAVHAVFTESASPDNRVRHWLTEGPDLPEWAEDDLISAGQRFFAQWPLPIATTLFCAALPTAYAAPRGAAVLVATSRLAQRGHVARRLAETGQMVFDVMDPTTPLRVPSAPLGAGRSGATGTRPLPLHPGSQGYLTVRNVRLLHGVVRQTLLGPESGDGAFATTGHVPINQEELLGTLLTFTVVVLDGLDRLGIPVSSAEAHAYVHTWSVVGALLGIDEELLPRTVDESHELSRTIARRQLAPSGDGIGLAQELLREMQMAMPDGCQRLPAALVHHLVPDIAVMLRVPAAGPVWRRVVEGACNMVHTSRRAPGLRELVAAGPGAAVGRSVLQLFMDRQEQAGMPPYRVAPGELLRRVRGRGGWRRVARRTARRERRGDAIGTRGLVVQAGRVEITLPASVALPIDAADVRLIATEGFPLWEPVDRLVRRNRCITVAYADLSRELAKVIAGGAEVRDANWCTFATWSSRTIGTFIEQIPERGAPFRLPAGGLRALLDIQQLTHLSMQRTGGASFRTLAAGNRVVFLEIGLAIATFIDELGVVTEDAHEREARWTAFWTKIETQLAGFAKFDESWMLTPTPKPDDLRRGLREYYEALHTNDLHQRSQKVLAGNLRIASYEQQRVDGYATAALALFTKRAMRRLICDRTGRVPGMRRWVDSGYALLLTKRMQLLLPGGEVLNIDDPVPPPIETADQWTDLATDAGITLPQLQWLVERFDVAHGDAPPDGCRNWTSFEERMRTIGWLFRLRQRQRNLFDDPFAANEEQS